MKRRDLPVFPLAPEPIRSGVSPQAQAVTLEIDAAGPLSGPRIGLVTLGCDKNTVDSEKMMAALVGGGARVSSEVEEADVVIVNTCGFIDLAKDQSIETIIEATLLKEAGGAKAVVAVGCLVQRYKEELQEEIPEVDLFLGLTELDRLLPELRDRGLLPEEDDSIPIMERPLRVLSSETPHTSFLKISEGCDHSCSFCAIPLMRGLHRSAPVEDLVLEAQTLEAQGVKELNIVSQDTTWYGRERRRRGAEGADAALLPGLLRALLEETGVPWYRLFYMYPSGITEEMVGLLADSSRLLPYLDAPIQHGSDRILEAMRRPERQKTIRERVRWLRDAVPDLTLRTTVIVGFPGETTDDFQILLDFLEEMQFERVGAFPYSVEEGTPAAGMDNQVPPETRRERLEEVMAVQSGISLELNQRHVGSVQRALVDFILDDDPDFGAVARTAGQAIDVDGVTNLLPGGSVKPGEFVEVEIVDALEHDLIGRVRGSCEELTPLQARVR